jgi:hypothetical protein
MKLTIRSAIMGAALSLIAGSAFAQATSSATGHGSVKIITPIALSENQALNFGTIVKPAASVTATVADTAAGAAGGTATRVTDSANAPASGIFKVTGENGYAFSITVPGTLSLSNGTATIPVSLTASDTSGTIGTTNSTTSGEAYYYVGGSMSLDNTTAVGAYAGTFTTSVAYN